MTAIIVKEIDTIFKVLDPELDLNCAPDDTRKYTEMYL